jgi:hypothetical protein
MDSSEIATEEILSQTSPGLRHRGTTRPTPTPTAAVFTDNYKDDLNFNGGGFYECNIW